MSRWSAPSADDYWDRYTPHEPRIERTCLHCGDRFEYPIRPEYDLTVWCPTCQQDVRDRAADRATRHAR